MRLLQSALYTPQPRESWSLSQLSCVTRPSLTEGPFFVDELLNRSDIRPDPSDGTVRPGTAVKLNLNVGKVSSGSCTPLSGAFVDLWHCDAAGGYSDVNGQGNPNNVGKRFLRGYQVTDSNGSVEFTTIYPGWYSGRTVHVHYKIRLFAGATRSFEFTSQLFFDDALTDAVFAAVPYNTRATRDTRNSNDNIYQSGGSTTLLSLASDGTGGYTTSYDIGLSNVPDSIAGISAVSAASYAGMLAPEGIGAIFGNGLATSMVGDN
jgi:protocatechuate 3,4-dioxygenase beta subunit